MGGDGILMVNGEFAPMTPEIVEAIKQLSGQPIRYLVNTHDHGDHTGGEPQSGDCSPRHDPCGSRLCGGIGGAGKTLEEVLAAHPTAD